jgi:hypothetical protein
MFEELGYASVLRPIGQMIESLRIESYSVWPDGDGFMIRDRTRNRAQITPREKALFNDKQSADGGSKSKEDELRFAAGIIEWRFDRSEIEKLELAGRERRRNPNQAPDAHAISQVLRVMGGIVDQRLGRLLSISKEGQFVSLNYLSSSGQTVSDDYSMATLYDFWVRMYKKRSSIDA